MKIFKAHIKDFCVSLFSLEFDNFVSINRGTEFYLIHAENLSEIISLYTNSLCQETILFRNNNHLVSYNKQFYYIYADIMNICLEEIYDSHCL